MRREVAPLEKIALGRAAAAMVEPGQVIVLDGGTTTRELARHLPPDLRATVITHSPTIAVELSDHAGIEVIMLGGRLFKHSMVNVGATTIEAAQAIRADLFFLGATGIHAREGLSTGDYEEAQMKRALCARAAETVVMASHEKLGAASGFVIIPASEVSMLIVPTGTPIELTQDFAALGIEVVHA
jgi:DeoR/GlpR family transcriptional regulator of sugar metabolism